MNEIQPTLLSLDPAAARAFEALVDYFERLDETGAYRSEGAHPHVAARSRGSGDSAAQAWKLGGMVLARALGDTSAPEEDTLMKDGDALLEAVTGEIQPYLDMCEEAALLYDDLPSPRSRKQPREQHVASAGALLCEIAREEWGIDATTSTGPDGQPVVLVTPIDPAMVVVRSFLTLMDILDRRIGLHLRVSPSADELLILERQASRWWFDTLSAPAPDDLDEFARRIREQEFSLFDREMLCLGETLACAEARALPKHALNQRQCALLDGIRRGVCGFFVVRQRRGPITVLEDIDTGRRYEIREYNMLLEYDQGSIIAGRLIPIDEIGWLCSPGAIRSRPATDATLSTIVNWIRSASEDVHRSIVVELIISRLGQAELRSIPPAESRKDAKEMLQSFHEGLVEADLDEVRCDQALEDWLCALREQCGLSKHSWGGDYDAAQSRKGKLSKRRRSR